MSLQRFINSAMSAWMNQEGPDSDIVLSSRIRLARNIDEFRFPALNSKEEAYKILELFEEKFAGRSKENIGKFELVKMNELEPVQKRVLVEKHLVSPHLAEETSYGGCLLSHNEEISIMLNEEDHIRIQCILPGLQLIEALNVANQLDDWIESEFDYAFDENRGYLTSCPTNVGTGLRASVMMHLPALVLTQQMNRIIQAIHQLGLVVRGIYGEGSEALGNIFQISNQITLGKSEDDIVNDLISVVQQLIQQERAARESLYKTNQMKLEDRIFRSLGTLSHSRIITSKEAIECLSDVRLGIDIGIIKDLSRNILNELMILIQPGFLQQYSGGPLSPDERDIRRATLIRERLQLEHEKRLEDDEHDVW